MQPFDLKAALAGAKLVTREGCDAVNFKRLTSEKKGSIFLYSAKVNGNTLKYTSNGHKAGNGSKSINDLFLVTVLAKSTILEQAQNLIYGDRQADYGSVTTNFTNIAKGWSVILGVDVTAEQVGLAMAWVKIARQANRKKRDNLVDIAGYVGCIEKLEKGE